MKIHINHSCTFMACCALLFSSCELTEVDNPYVTEDRYITSFQSLDTWLNGVRRQASATVGTVVEFSELVSDNYFNNYTQSSKVFDIPQINHFDVDVANIQASIHKLLEVSDFGLVKLVPVQNEDVSQQHAELLLYKAYAYILGADLYVGIPITPLGEVNSAQQLREKAIELLRQASDLFTADVEKEACNILIARCYHGLGNIQEAIRYAQLVVQNPLSLRQVMYGTQTGPSNNFQSAIYSATTNSFAPLPRLDFLDPKYFHQTATVMDDEKPIAIAKAEEGYLILAEAYASQGNLDMVKKVLKDLLNNTVSKRPMVMLDDSRELRNGGNRNDYPLVEVQVQFDAQSEAKSGLVVDRKAGMIKAYSVSGTHVTVEDIDAISSQDEALYTIYLLRQEIFIAEGRRMTDLGIRFPVSQREELSNTHVATDHTKAVIPDFIPLEQGMDDFEYDMQAGLVTIKYDMNKILVANKRSALIMPLVK